MTNPYWQTYWSTRNSGGHRRSDEEFLLSEAREKIFYLGTGRALLDLGCGSAELLTYFASGFSIAVGSDFSPSMIAQARERVSRVGLQNVTLIVASEQEIWQQLGEQKFSCITAGQVIQYLTLPQIDNLIREASGRLEPDGKIVLFDVIDPVLYPLAKAGILGRKRFNLLTLCARLAVSGLRGSARVCTGKPWNEIGNAYMEQEFEHAARSNGLRVQKTNSMFYEYRYHLVFTRSGDA